eukprot:jgi/Bigna1/91817/estExt_fgenesh1_pg.C_1210030
MGRYVFLDIAIEGKKIGRMIFELYASTCPRTAENFRALCTGEKGLGKKSGKPLHYKGSSLHRVIKGFMAQGGDFTNNDGTGGESIYGGMFQDENFMHKHLSPGTLSMANRGPGTNASQFFITFGASKHLNGKHVVFGKICEGIKILETIEATPTDNDDRPRHRVVIQDCGEMEQSYRPLEQKKEESEVADMGYMAHVAKIRSGKKLFKKRKKRSGSTRRKTEAHHGSSSETACKDGEAGGGTNPKKGQQEQQQSEDQQRAKKAKVEGSSASNAIRKEGAVERVIKATNHFEVLGFDPPTVSGGGKPEWLVTQQELKKRFRKLSVFVHPDRCRDNPQASDAFDKVRKAHDLLSENASREAYMLQYLKEHRDTMLRAAGTGGGSTSVRERRKQMQKDLVDDFNHRVADPLIEVLQKKRVVVPRTRMPTPLSSSDSDDCDSEEEKWRAKLTKFKKKKHGKSLFF